MAAEPPAVPVAVDPRPGPLARRLLAEFLGTGLLVAIVVGSGIAAHRLSPGDTGLALLENALATALGLVALILLFGPVSGAHLNPVVTAADWLLHRGSPAGVQARDIGPYVAVQLAGAVAGSTLANAMFDTRQAISRTHRVTTGHLIGEVVATSVLVALVFALVRTGRTAIVAPAIGAYIGAAYWFTSSTSFANPAVTVGRVFTDTFAGIAPSSVAPFIAAQMVGAVIGTGLTLVLYPTKEQQS